MIANADVDPVGIADDFELKCFTLTQAKFVMRNLVLLLLVMSWSSVGGCSKGEKPPDVKIAATDDFVEEEDSLEPAYLPGGVADFAGKTGYLCNPKGGIDAVDLETGKVVWHSDEASQPLIVYKGLVLAQEEIKVNPFKIIGLNVTDGKRVLVSDPIQNEVEIPAFSLWLDARIREGHLYLDWGNFTPRRAEDAALEDVATGRIKRLPKDGHTTRHQSTTDYLKIAKIAADAESMGARYILSTGVVAKLENPKPRELFEGRALREIQFKKRWIAGGALALHVHKIEDEATTDLLVCWDSKTGKHLHSVVMQVKEHPSQKIPSAPRTEGRASQGHLTLGYNGRFVVSYYTDRGLGAGPVKLLSVPTGKWQGPFRLEYDDKAVANFCPVGSRLFYVGRGEGKAADDVFFPQTLKAVDMATERVLWERRVGQTFIGGE